MSNYFILELDTNPPVLSVEYEQKVDPTKKSIVKISSDETIYNIEAKIVDSLKRVHPLNFESGVTVSEKEIDYSGMSSGLADLFITASDDVGNISTISKVFIIQTEKPERADSSISEVVITKEQFKKVYQDMEKIYRSKKKKKPSSTTKD